MTRRRTDHGRTHAARHARRTAARSTPSTSTVANGRTHDRRRAPRLHHDAAALPPQQDLVCAGPLHLRRRLQPDGRHTESLQAEGRLMGTSWLSVPRDWIASFGDIAKFCARVVFREVFGGRVFRFFGEALRQAGILIVGSTLVIWGLVLHPRAPVRHRGRVLQPLGRRPRPGGRLQRLVRPARDHALRLRLHDGAKVGTGIVAELGAMRISDEIDALEVMGISSMTFLCATRLLAAWMVLPFMYIAGDRRRLLRLLPGGRAADRRGVLRRLLPDLLDVPEPARPLLQR